MRLRRQVNLAKDLFGWHGGRWPDTLSRQHTLVTLADGHTLGFVARLWLVVQET